MKTPRYSLVAIVEGHGEVRALPRLVQRWLAWRSFKNFDVEDSAVRACGVDALKHPCDAGGELGVEYYVELALCREPDGILVVFDSDRECIERRKAGGGALGPEMQARAERAARGVPVEVVVANRRFEAWFLSSWEYQVRRGAFSTDFSLATSYDIERHGGKQKVAAALGRPYEEAIDMLCLAESVEFREVTFQRSPSLGKFSRSLERLCSRARDRRKALERTRKGA